MKELHLTLQVRNNLLRERRVALGLTIAELCRRTGVQPHDYSELERLKASPLLRDRYKGRWLATRSQWRPCVIKIAEFYRCEPAELFPADIFLVEKPLVERTFDVSEARAALSSATLRAALSPDKSFEAKELRLAVESALSTLTPREEMVIRKKFGLGGEAVESRNEIATNMGVSCTSVSRFEAHAVAKLRHPSWCRRLHSALNGDPQ